uniref:BTB domain-containing protein n=1 Tax=Panagrellus redivivus TaxID=6233 RepID=A0A7E4VCV8_PANRE
MPNYNVRRVAFNVGGKVFETTESTIRRIAGTRLTALLDEAEVDEEPVDNGRREFFIDHDPRYFEAVLNFLRSRSFPVDYAEHIVDDLEREAKFYGISELANCCRSLREPLKLNDEVQWRRDAIESYWRNFVQCVVDNTLRIPFTFEKNSHFFSKCIACREECDPKCSGVYDIHVDDWTALAHHMQSMTGTVIKIVGTTCVIVKFDNETTVHLPRTALKRKVKSFDVDINTQQQQPPRKLPLTVTTSIR